MANGKLQNLEMTDLPSLIFLDIHLASESDPHENDVELIPEPNQAW